MHLNNVISYSILFFLNNATLRLANKNSTRIQFNITSTVGITFLQRFPWERESHYVGALIQYLIIEDYCCRIETHGNIQVICLVKVSKVYHPMDQKDLM